MSACVVYMLFITLPSFCLAKTIFFNDLEIWTDAGWIGPTKLELTMETASAKLTLHGAGTEATPWAQGPLTGGNSNRLRQWDPAIVVGRLRTGATPTTSDRIP